MANFVLSCLDKSDGLALRLGSRQAHLAYVRAQPQGFVLLAGPFLDDAGEMCGSLFIIEAPDIESVRAFSAADPYVSAGLFQSVEIRPWRAAIYPP